MKADAAVHIGKDKDIGSRVEALDWSRVATDLDAQGWAMLNQLLTRQECQALADLYHSGGRFCSQVTMARHGFGRAEYVMRAR